MFKYMKYLNKIILFYFINVRLYFHLSDKTGFLF